MPNRCSASSPEPPAREWRFQTRFGSTCNLWGSAQSLPQCSWQKGHVAPQAPPTAALKNAMNSLNKNPTKKHAQFGGLKFDFLGCSHEIVGKIQNDLVPWSSLPAMRSNSAAFSLEEFSIETISSSLLKTTVWCAGIGDSLPVTKIIPRYWICSALIRQHCTYYFIKENCVQVQILNNFKRTESFQNATRS